MSLTAWNKGVGHAHPELATMGAIDGARTAEGKAVVCCNARKGGTRETLRTLARALNGHSKMLEDLGG